MDWKWPPLLPEAVDSIKYFFYIPVGQPDTTSTESYRSAQYGLAASLREEIGKEVILTELKLKEIHKDIWAFRAEMDDRFFSPDPLDSLRYAATEAAEALEAQLRQDRPGDLRGRERDLDVLAELADCAIMLCTALIDVEDLEISEFELPQARSLSSLERIGYFVWGSLYEHAMSDLMWKRRARVALHLIARYPNMDLAREVQDRLARIRARVPVPVQALDGGEGWGRPRHG